MINASRMTARFAVVASFAALLSAACAPDAKDPSAPSTPVASAIQAPSLGAPKGPSSSFAVLANAAVTCTDGTIAGSVGTFQATPTGSITQTSCPVTGSLDVGTGASIQAFNAFLAAYAADSATPCGVVLTGTLAGVTLAPGVYCFDAAATLTGTLTLKGPSNGVWLFKIGTLGTGALTGTNFSVVMAGGGDACNVTWWVSQAATMTTSNFEGDILAGAAITTTGGTLNGNLWSRADVTITGTAVVGCAGGKAGKDKDKDNDKHEKCNQGVGNGREGCDPGDSNHHHGSNDEDGGKPGDPGRQGGDRH